MSPSNRKSAIFCVGNPLRRDDGIGIKIFNCLKIIPSVLEKADLFDFGSFSVDIVFKLSRYKKALIVDGINAGLKPGELRIFALKDLKTADYEPVSCTHGLDLKFLFRLMAEQGSVVKVWVAGIQAVDSSFGEGLSKELSGNIDAYVDEISSFTAKNL